MIRTNLKKNLFAFVIGCLLILPAVASEVSSAAFVEGCRAYSEGDWNSAELLLKKAVAYEENQNADTYYMLITAEVSSGNDREALNDCNLFLETFPESLYFSRVQYHKGRLLYRLGEYEKAIIFLSDFCHQNEGDDMYSFALFYIAESLFAGYKYDEAASIYQRIVADFPDSEKSAAAQYRIESILQRAREEKLLYLLKQTGEEYLSAKEEYEKQLRLYNADSVNSTKQRLAESQQKNKELEDRVRDLEMQLAALKLELTNNIAATQAASNDSVSKREIKIEEPVATLNVEIKKPEKTDEQIDVPSEEPFDENRDRISELKKKALDAQKLLDSKK